MQGGRGRGIGNPLFGFGDPFANFGGMPDLFGGRDPFDDPFFTRPFGGIFSSGPLGSPFMDLNPFGSSPFGPRSSPFGPRSSPFGPQSSLFGPRSSPFMVEQAPVVHETRPPLPNSSRGPIIEELNSDDEKEQPDGEDSVNRNSRGPYIVHPDDEFEARVESGVPRQTRFGNELNLMNSAYGNPQAHNFTFQSSSVTYGGSNGAYYTSSTTKRSGSDGLTFEEYKEADATTGQAAHRVSRGIHDKGHTVTRNLKSDGQVDTMQVLHNINEDELDGFEENWQGKARKHLPGWSVRSSIQQGDARGGGWALPSSEQVRNHGSSSGLHVGTRRRADGAQDNQSSKTRRV